MAPTELGSEPAPGYLPRLPAAGASVRSQPASPALFLGKYDAARLPTVWPSLPSQTEGPPVLLPGLLHSPPPRRGAGRTGRPHAVALLRFGPVAQAAYPQADRGAGRRVPPAMERGDPSRACRHRALDASGGFRSRLRGCGGVGCGLFGVITAGHRVRRNARLAAGIAACLAELRLGMLRLPVARVQDLHSVQSNGCQVRRTPRPATLHRSC